MLGRGLGHLCAGGLSDQFNAGDVALGLRGVFPALSSLSDRLGSPCWHLSPHGQTRSRVKSAELLRVSVPHWLRLGRSLCSKNALRVHGQGCLRLACVCPLQPPRASSSRDFALWYRGQGGSGPWVARIYLPSKPPEAQAVMIDQPAKARAAPQTRGEAGQPPLCCVSVFLCCSSLFRSQSP